MPAADSAAMGSMHAWPCHAPCSEHVGAACHARVHLLQSQCCQPASVHTGLLVRAECSLSHAEVSAGHMLLGLTCVCTAAKPTARALYQPGTLLRASSYTTVYNSTVAVAEPSCYNLALLSCAPASMRYHHTSSKPCKHLPGTTPSSGHLTAPPHHLYLAASFW